MVQDTKVKTKRMILDIVRALASNFISWSFTPGGGDHTKVFYHLCMRRNSIAETFRRSNDCSNFNDSVNHSAHKELLKNPGFFFRGVHSTNWCSPEIHLCTCSLPGCGELVPRLTEELSERNIFHHSFPPCLGQCTRHSVTWCNVRATGRLAVAGGWVSVWRRAVCMCATEPWLPHY